MCRSPRATVTAALAAFAVAAASAGHVASDAAAARLVYAGYFGGWNVKGYYPKDIRARRLTHVYYAFAVPGADGTCAPTSPWADYQRPFAAGESVGGVPDAPTQALKGNFNQLRKLKAANRGLKVSIAIGGWGGSRYFSDVAATRAARNRFAASCVNRFIRGNLPGARPGAGAGVFNGLDIDWEYPGGGAPGNHTRPNDKANATRLFRTLRRHLDRESARTGRRYLLTAGLPVGTSRYALSRVASVLDWANLMTYDLHGPWESETNFNAPLDGRARLQPEHQGRRRRLPRRGRSAAEDRHRRPLLRAPVRPRREAGLRPSPAVRQQRPSRRRRLVGAAHHAHVSRPRRRRRDRYGFTPRPAGAQGLHPLLEHRGPRPVALQAPRRISLRQGQQVSDLRRSSVDREEVALRTEAGPARRDGLGAEPGQRRPHARPRSVSEARPADVGIRRGSPSGRSGWIPAWNPPPPPHAPLRTSRTPG